MTAKIRKHQTTLICSGLAVIAFGLWSVVRSFLLFFFNLSFIRAAATEMVLAEHPELSVDLVLVVSAILAILMLGADLIFRLFVGLSALAEGGGKRKRIVYVVLSALYLVFSLCSDASIVLAELDALTMETVTAVFVDFSSCIAFYEVIRSSLAIRRYERGRNAGQGETYAA